MLNTPQQVKMNINLDELKTVTCPNCKNPILATNLSMFKRIPGIQSPTGKAQLIRVELISCLICNRYYQIRDAELFPITEEYFTNEA